MSEEAERRTAPHPRRGLPRFEVTLDAYLRDGPNRLPVKVSDLNSDGCRVEGDIFLEQATEVWLKIPGLTPCEARVAWSRAGQAGCEFVKPLDEAKLKAMLEARAAEERARLVDRRFHP